MPAIGLDFVPIASPRCLELPGRPDGRPRASRRRPVKGNSVPFGEHLQRRRPSCRWSSWVALAVAVGGVVTYAVQADGYQAHRAELNDGGIWVTSNQDGSYGRINKPIGELDGTVFTQPRLQPRHRPGRLVGRRRQPQSDGVVVPAGPRPDEGARRRGGRDPGQPRRRHGRRQPRRAGRRDRRALGDPRGPRRSGVPSRHDRWPTRADPLATVGEDAALAVALDGTVLRRVRDRGPAAHPAPAGRRPGSPQATTQDLPGDALQRRHRAHRRRRGARRPRLRQRPAGRHRRRRGRGAAGLGPAAARAQRVARSWSARATRLLSVDLATGDGDHRDRRRRRRPGRTRSASATASYGAWSGGTGAVVTACGGGAGRTAGPRRHDHRPGLPHQPRPDRAQRPRHRQRLGRRLRQADPARQLGRLPPRVRGRERGRRRRPAEPGRPPAAEGQERQPRGAAGPHHDPAPARQRHRPVRPAARDPVGARRPTARARSSPSAPTARPCQITLPGDAVGGTSFEYFIDDGRQSVSAHAHGPRGHRRRRSVQRRAAAAPGLRVAGLDRARRAAPSTSPCSPTGATRRTGTRSPRSSAQRVGGGTAAADGRASPRPAAVRFQAPQQGGPVQVDYDVTDGLGDPVTETLDFRVQQPDDLETVAPIAEPDVIAGETGQPIAIRAAGQRPARRRPVHPRRHAVAGRQGRQRARRRGDHQPGQGHGHACARTPAQTYFLDYQAAYGSAETDTGKIRVDVRAPEIAAPRPGRRARHASRSSARRPRSSTCWPTTSTRPAACCRCSAPTPLAANQLDVAVVNGRWLRISRPAGRSSRPTPRSSATRSATASARASPARWWSASGRCPRTTPRSPRTTR